MEITMKNGVTVINGKQYVGKVIHINDGVITIDGVAQKEPLPQKISIQITGDVDKIDGNIESITVSGSCGSVKTVSGNVSCGDVSGDVRTTSGDIECSDVYGKVKTISGDIRTNKKG